MGLFGDLFNQTQPSSVTQLNSVLNQAISSELVQASSSGSGVISAEQSVIIAGNTGGSIRGLNLSQVAQVNISVLQHTDVNSQMQTDVTNKILSTLEQQSSSGFPELTSASTNVDIRTQVKNLVAHDLSSSALATLQAAITAKQSILIASNTGTDISDVKLVQKTDAIGTLINNLSSQVITSTINKTDSSTDIKQRSVNFLVGLTDSIGNTLNNLFKLSPETIILLIIAVIVAGIVGFFAIKKGAIPTRGGHGSAAGMQISDGSPYVR
jgi:hypothetical protein